MRLRERVLHLAEDLRLAENHGIEPGGDAKRVSDRSLVGVAVKIRVQRVAVQAVIVAEPLDQPSVVRGFEVAVKLGAIAGGENRRLVHRAVAGEFAQGVHEFFRHERDLLADFHRSGLVIYAEGKQVHGRRPGCGIRAGILGHHGTESSCTI